MKSKTKKTILISIISVLTIALVIVGTGFGYVHYQLSKIEKVDIPKNPESLAVNKEAEEKSKSEDIVNIALYGIDARDVDGDDPSRSDSIIILSIDKNDKIIKLSSIMRDTYVEIKGREGKDKINHAYAFGGGELALNTLNSNFNLDIKDFVAVNFYALEKIIDSLGGVKINVTSEEIGQINSLSQGMAMAEGKTVTPLTSTGEQSLNGIQAVAYSRIRYATGGDYKRTERQRTVLAAMINKVLSSSPTEMYSLATELLPYVKTSMSNTEILSLGKEVLGTGFSKIEQKLFPEEGKGKGKDIGGVYYMVTDLNETSKDLHNFIYNEK